jgi:hypothetical protein
MMKNNIRKCPNCAEVESEAYRQGWNDAMKLYQDAIIKARDSRPMRYILPKGADIKKIQEQSK